MSAQDLRRQGLSYRLTQENRAAARGLVERNRDFACLTLLLTYRCPAVCDHCIFESSPKATATLDPGTAERVIAAISRQSPPPGLSFSGGEPFLQLDTMKRLAAFALERGMPSEAVTSAAWVADAGRTRATLAELGERGLRTLCVSYDRFHAPYVKAEKIRTAVTQALELGIRVVVNTMADPDDVRERREMLAEALALPLAVVDSCFVNVLPTSPVGRARTHVDRYYYPDHPPTGGCQFAGRIVAVSPYGFVYPCCGSVLGAPPERAGLMIQDDLTGRSVDEIAAILEDLKNDLFFNLLSVLGPYGILQELRKREPALQTRPYTNQCDACLEFTDNPLARGAAEKLLIEMSEALAATEAA